MSVIDTQIRKAKALKVHTRLPLTVEQADHVN